MSIHEALATDRRLTIRGLVELWYDASGLEGRFANVERNSKL